jgi:hypothetical protein
VHTRLALAGDRAQRRYDLRVQQPAPIDSVSLIAALGEPVRRRVVAALILGSQSLAEVIVATGDSGPAVLRACDRLTQYGLVNVDGDRVVLFDEVFSELARSQSKRPEVGVSDPAATGEVDADAERAKVLRAYFRDGRLTHLPTTMKKRLVVLDVLAAEFVPGQLYSEARVNLMLGQVHADTAALRRALVDADFLSRRDGMYWRSGGTFDPFAEPANEPTGSK